MITNFKIFENIKKEDFNTILEEVCEKLSNELDKYTTLNVKNFNKIKIRTTRLGTVAIIDSYKHLNFIEISQYNNSSKIVELKYNDIKFKEKLEENIIKCVILDFCLNFLSYEYAISIKNTLDEIIMYIINKKYIHLLKMLLDSNDLYKKYLNKYDYLFNANNFDLI